VHLIEQQVAQARVVHQMLHLLSLNSIVEASRLGARANPILEIGNGISELSMEWSRITDRSDQSMQEIQNLVEHISHLMATFSEAGDQRLQAAQEQTRQALQSLHSAADLADGQARKIEHALNTMQSMSTGIGRSSDALDAAHEQVGSTVSGLLDIQRQLQTEIEFGSPCNATEMEQMFSSSYTTETERDVMQAALHGAALPAVQQVHEGNGVELF
jgi:ElaB/YqjD/DUF883 family membrane-anchored ribosome-binding protein